MGLLIVIVILAILASGCAASAQQAAQCLNDPSLAVAKQAGHQDLLCSTVRPAVTTESYAPEDVAACTAGAVEVNVNGKPVGCLIVLQWAMKQTAPAAPTATAGPSCPATGCEATSNAPISIAGDLIYVIGGRLLPNGEPGVEYIWAAPKAFFTERALQPNMEVIFGSGWQAIADQLGAGRAYELFNDGIQAISDGTKVWVVSRSNSEFGQISCLKTESNGFSFWWHDAGAAGTWDGNCYGDNHLVTKAYTITEAQNAYSGDLGVHLAKLQEVLKTPPQGITVPTPLLVWLKDGTAVFTK